jgi:hypothetical protein
MIVNLARDRGLPQFLAYGKFLLGWAQWSNGQPHGEAEMREGRAMLQEMGIHPLEAFFGTLLAELEASAGRIEAGLGTLDSQLELRGRK